MSVEFFDGFEIYGTTLANLLLGRWNTNTSVSSITNLPTARTGGYCLALLTGAERSLKKSGLSNSARRVFGFAFQTSSLAATMTFFRVFDGSTVQVQLRFNSTTGTISILNGDGTVLETSALSIAINTWYYFELDVTINNTTGSYILKVDEVTFMNSTNKDTQNSANSYSNAFDLYHTTSGAPNHYFDDIYVDTNTMHGACSVHPLGPNGDGNSSQFTGSDGNSVNNYALVDEAPPNDDTDYVYSTTVGHKDLYGMSNLGVSVGEVVAVQAHAYAKKVDIGTRQIESVIRTNSNDFAGDDKTLTTSYAYYTTIWEDNPDTLNAFSLAEVDALEVGVGIVA